MEGKTFENFRDELATAAGYKDIHMMMWNWKKSFEINNEAAQLYAKQCCELSLKKASENVEVNWFNDYPFGKVFESVNIESITDPDNIVIL